MTTKKEFSGQVREQGGDLMGLNGTFEGRQYQIQTPVGVNIQGKPWSDPDL